MKKLPINLKNIKIDMPIPTIEDYLNRPAHPDRKEGGIRVSGKLYKASASNKPLISIITVVFNGAKTLEKTILSVLGQTYENIEYIVIDGASTDRTLDILYKYNENIFYWISEPDEGISDAFNKGISIAEGDIIGILNAGDWYEKQTVSIIVEYSLSNPNYNMFYSDIMMFNEHENIAYTRKANKKLNLDCFKYKMPKIPHPTVFTKRKVYEEIGYFNLQLKFAMDYELLRRAYTKGYNFLCINHTHLANMTVEGASNSNYGRTLNEVYKISTNYGDNQLISFIYNRVFRYFRFQLRTVIERNSLGIMLVKYYRIFTSKMRGWEY